MDAQLEAMIAEHLPLAQALAQKVWRQAPHALDLDELKGIANLGLVAAADRWHPYCAERSYDPGRLEYFRPFAVRRVQGALIDAIRAADWATRSLRTRAKALQAAGQEKGLSDRELSERSGLTVKEVRATIRGMAQRPHSLDAEAGEPPASTDIESTVATRIILARMVATIRDLAPEQQTVIALHYHRGLQLQEVAKIMGITESRASQLHARAVLTVHTALMSAATA